MTEEPDRHQPRDLDPVVGLAHDLGSPPDDIEERGPEHTRDEVRELASQMAEVQRTEIDELNARRAELGFAPVE